MTAGDIRREDLWGLTHYFYGEAYFGSHSGMRFRLAREPLKNVAYDPPEVQTDAQLKVSVWPEPFAYGQTSPDKITDAFFSFSEEGMCEAVDWLNEQYKKGIFPPVQNII